ncbi:MAG: hypothetical protein JWO47_1073 [Candidatus Saccharibacteria bacterium]|nr:hypothetical protein [Candidatus Saccharibacteria bacterium]
MAERDSFERAVILGKIQGPDGFVTDEEGQIIDPGSQYFKHAHRGREVRQGIGKGSVVGYVLDYQDPTVVEWAETKPMSGSSPLVRILEEFNLFVGSRMHQFGED